MSRYDLVINGNSYAVTIGQLSGSSASVEVNGVAYQVEIRGGQVASVAPAPAAAPRQAAQAPAPAAPVQPKPAPAKAAPAAPTAEGELVVAPMPGHVLSVAVKVGDKVNVGDTVVVMEAMKMENDIKSHAAGTVKEVLVAPGQDVGVNAILVVIGA